MIKDLLPRQVVCNQKGQQGKPCHGKLKRYHPLDSYYNESDPGRRGQIKDEFGENRTLVLLRCEECLTLFRLPEELKEKFG